MKIPSHGKRPFPERSRAWLTWCATGPRTVEQSTPCIDGCSASTPQRRAVCAGSGNTGETPTTPPPSPRSGSRARVLALIGHYATMPVRLSLKGKEIQGSWGMDVMVAPERQRQGLGEVLFRTWDRTWVRRSARPLGIVAPAVSETEMARRGTCALLRQAAHPPRAAAPRLASRPQSARVGGHAAGGEGRRANRPLRAEVRLLQRFDDSFTGL